jgi:hypothetical protein
MKKGIQKEERKSPSRLLQKRRFWSDKERIHGHSRESTGRMLMYSSEEGCSVVGISEAASRK